MRNNNYRLKFGAFAFTTLMLVTSFGQAQVLDALRGKVPASKAEIGLSFAPIVKSAAPAVVNVYASQKAPKARNPFEGDPFFRALFWRSGPA